MVGGSLRFHDKGVECDGTLADKEAVDCAVDTVPAARPQLKQAIAESPRIRQLQFGPVPFGHWTLRDEAAQRRSSLRFGLP